jgi:hypothetical protein
MDPITTAIVAVVTAGVTDIGKKAFADVYQGLKGLIKSKFGQDNKISKAIADLEDNPELKGRQLVLAENMAMEKADQDPELINIAKQLVQALNKTEAGRRAVAKYQIDAKGAQIGNVGDNAKIEGGIHFGDNKK